MELKDNLRKLREEKKLNQTEMAKLLDLTISGYSKWEQGRTMPNPKQLMQLSKLYNISTDELLGLSSELIERPVADMTQKNIYILSEKEIELIEYFRLLKAFQRGELIGIARTLAKGGM